MKFILAKDTSGIALTSCYYVCHLSDTLGRNEAMQYFLLLDQFPVSCYSFMFFYPLNYKDR